jgi:hypothetical protein
MGSFRARPNARAVPTTERARTFAFPPKATFEAFARLNAPRESATSASTRAKSRKLISPRLERYRASVLTAARRMLTLRAHDLDYSSHSPTVVDAIASRARTSVAASRASVADDVVDAARARARRVGGAAR